jgi:acyl-CoA thioester hydrolase
VTSPASRRPAPRRQDFPHWVTDTIRYGDLDRQNHVNNAVFSTYLETGRVLLQRGPENGLLVPDAEFALVRVTIDFRCELHWPGTVDIGTAIAHLGTSSLTFAQGIFQGDTCAASAESILVLLDAKTRRPRPYPDDVAARIRSTMPRAPGPE